MIDMATAAMLEIVAEAPTAQWSQVVPIAALSPWQIQSVKGVLQMAQIPDGWDSYGSKRPSPAVVDRSIHLVRSVKFDDLPVPYVVPVVGGGIQFEWIVGGRELEIEVLPDGSVEYLKSGGGEQWQEGKIDAISQLRTLLAWVTSA